MEEEYAAKERVTKLPLSQQDKALAELHDVLGELTSRLKSVLTPGDTERATDQDKAAPSQSPLADQLDSNNAQIRRATNRVNSLIERLEC